MADGKQLLDLSLREIIDEAARCGARAAWEEAGSGNGSRETKWLSVKKAAEAVDVSEPIIYDAISVGALPCYQPAPRCTRIDRAELDEWVRSHKSS